jgi:hypothetical protein
LVVFTYPTQQAAEPNERSGIATRTTPTIIIKPREPRSRRLLAIVEKLVHWDFHGLRQLFQGFDCRNSVAVLEARNVTAQKPGALLDVALGQLFLFAQSLQPLSNEHQASDCGDTITRRDVRTLDKFRRLLRRMSYGRQKLFEPETGG